MKKAISIMFHLAAAVCFVFSGIEIYQAYSADKPIGWWNTALACLGMFYFMLSAINDDLEAYLKKEPAGAAP